MKESAYYPFFRLLSKLILPLDALSDCIVKVMKPLNDIPEISTAQFVIYHPHYKEKLGMIESIYNPFLLRLSPKLILPLHTSLNYIFKFATYHPYYKKKLGITDSRYDADLFYKSDNLAAFFLACD